MKTQNTKAFSTPATQKEAVEETKAEQPAVMDAKPILKIGKASIELDRLNEALHAAHCLAGRIARKALDAGIGRVAKDMTSGGTLVATLSILPDLKRLGHLGEVESKEGKEEVKAIIETIQGLNKIMDGLELLKLAKRR